NVKLTGKGRTYDQKIGFDNKFSGVDYFTYDLTGAYAPLAAEIPATGLGDILESDKDNIFGYVSNQMLYLKNIPEQSNVSVYNSMGLLVFKSSNYVAGSGIPLNNHGVYIGIVKVGMKTRSVKIVY
ncbi:MAG: hypothetical protein PHS59_16915, partial [Paludibacter sp.]|nr:hypothetical protein [Paludibacter sp.]